MNKKTQSVTIAVALASCVPCHAAITTVMELHMGEAGSTGTNNLSLDTSGNGYHMDTKHGGGSLVISTASPAAPGSSAYTTFDGTAAMSTTLWKDAAGTDNLPTNNFAMEMWVRQSDTSGWQRYMRSATIGTIAFSNRTTTNQGNLQLNGVVGASIDTASGMAVDTWYHLAMIRDNGVTRFYQDGVAISGSFNQAPVWANNFTIGQKAHNDGTQRFQGDMDEVRLFTFEAGDDPVAALSINAVPEPSSISLLALGGLVLTMRRRK